MRSRPPLVALLLALAAGPAGPAALATPSSAGEDPPLPWAAETIHVDLRTVPFYAVDADGEPVEDLRRDEIRLLVEGEAVEVDVFSRLSDPSLPAAGAAAVTGVPRHVFILLDVLFTSPNGLMRAKTAGLSFARGLGPRDRIHLIVNRRSGGFSEVLGPVAADEPGLAALAKALKAELPDVGSVRSNLGDDLPEPLSGARHGNDNVKVARWMIGDMGRAEYRAAAEDLAGGLATLAARLRGVPGPKLLVMLSGGLDSTLYFHGWERHGPGSSASYQSGFRPQSPLRYRFEAPLAALVDSGVQTAFVGVDRAESSGRDTLAHLGKATGGLYLEDPDAESVAARLARRTSARYEAGWYAGAPGVPVAGSVRVVSLRPGVELWSPRSAGGRVVARRPEPDERRFLIVDLVHRGVEPGAAGERRGLVDLAGQLGAHVEEAGGKTIVFAPSWPPALQADGAELYDVLVRLDRASGRMNLVRFDRSTPKGSELPRRLSPRLAGDGPFVWGIVAIDRASGTTYLRRLMLESPRRDAAVERPVSR